MAPLDASAIAQMLLAGGIASIPGFIAIGAGRARLSATEERLREHTAELHAKATTADIDRVRTDIHALSETLSARLDALMARVHL